MIKNFAFTNKENETDRNFDLKVITQYFEHFSIDLLKKADVIEEIGEDSFSEDFSSEGFSDAGADEDHHEENNVHQQQTIAQIPIQMDTYGHIFFVTYHDGCCNIKEINPWHDHEHIFVYQIKSA